jgi:lipopolysaccharide export LptBFGC system permease protein LptF
MIADVVFLCVMASTLGNSHLTLNQKGACVIAVSVLGMIFAFLGTGLWVIADGKRPSWVWQTLTIAAILMLTISYLSLHAFDVVVHLL